MNHFRRRLWRDVHDALLFAVLAVDAVGFDVPVAHKTGSSVQRCWTCPIAPDVTSLSPYRHLGRLTSVEQKKGFGLERKAVGGGFQNNDKFRIKGDYTKM